MVRSPSTNGPGLQLRHAREVGEQVTQARARARPGGVVEAAAAAGRPHAAEQVRRHQQRRQVGGGVGAAYLQHLRRPGPARAPAGSSAASTSCAAAPPVAGPRVDPDHAALPRRLGEERLAGPAAGQRVQRGEVHASSPAGRGGRTDRSRRSASSAGRSTRPSRGGPTAPTGTATPTSTRRRTARSSATSASCGGRRGSPRTRPGARRRAPTGTCWRSAPAPASAPAGCAPRADARSGSTCPSASSSTPAASTTSSGVAVPSVLGTATAAAVRRRQLRRGVLSFGALQFVADIDVAVGEAARVLRPGRPVRVLDHPPDAVDVPRRPGRGGPGRDASPTGTARRTSRSTTRPARSSYVEHHRTLGDWVALLAGAGFVLTELLEPEWPEGHDRVWGGWSGTRGRFTPGHRDLRGRPALTTLHLPSGDRPRSPRCAWAVPVGVRTRDRGGEKTHQPHRPPDAPRTSRRSARELDDDPAGRSSTSRGERDAAYIRRVIDAQRTLELGSRVVLLARRSRRPGCSAPPACALAKILDNMEIGHNVLHGQWDWMRDPKIHSTTWEWDHASPAAQWKRAHNETAPHATPTSSARTTTSATASCASTRTSRGSRATSSSRCGTSSTPASSSTASRCTTSTSATHAAAEARA